MKKIDCDNVGDKNLLKYENYGRLQGWILTNKLDLPTQKFCYLIEDVSEINWQVLSSLGSVLYCRADAHWGEGNKLLRSADISELEKLIAFTVSAKEEVEDAIILVFQHPSIWLTGEYLERYKTTGAGIILFDWESAVTLEMVGPGYDSGDISRGKSVHSRIEIPWDQVFEGSQEIYRNASFLGQSYFIPNDLYLESRKKRIEELVLFYGSSYVKYIEEAISTQVTHLDEKMFKQIYEVFIEKIIYSNQLSHESSYAIMFNLYEDKPYAYEVWQPKRSMF